jgi:hypothetical protein
MTHLRRALAFRLRWIAAWIDPDDTDGFESFMRESGR